MPSAEQLLVLGQDYYQNQAFHVHAGAAYVVLGLTFHIRSNLYGTAMTVEIQDDYGRLATVPLCLFEIVDEHLSTYWVIRHWTDGTVAMWPPSFFADFYHDDLSEGVAEVVSDYARVKRQIEAEADAGSSESRE